MTYEERAIEELKYSDMIPISNQTREMAINALNREQHMLEFGYKGEVMEFNIRGRKFVVREVAQ